MVKDNHALSNSALFASVLSRFDNVLGQFAVDRLSVKLTRTGGRRAKDRRDGERHLPSFLFYAFPRRAYLAVLARSLGACRKKPEKLTPVLQANFPATLVPDSKLTCVHDSPTHWLTYHHGELPSVHLGVTFVHRSTQIDVHVKCIPNCSCKPEKEFLLWQNIADK